MGTQEGPYPDTPKGAYIGYADTDESRLYFEFPDCPQDPKDYINWDLPEKEQVWMREEEPEDWKEDSIESVAYSKYDGNMDWWLDDELWTNTMRGFFERRWKHRNEGAWVLINGKPTYLTADYMFFLENYKMDVGYPEYRDRDRRFFYAWEVALKDFHCYGLLYIKHRRDGATHRACSMILNRATKTERALFALKSTTHGHAIGTFKTMLIPALQDLPIFFRPVVKGSDNPNEDIIFDNPPRRGKYKFGVKKRRGLKTQILTLPTKHKGHDEDGKKIEMEVRDELGKPSIDNKEEWWEVLMPALTNNGKPNKIFLPTTVEEEDKPGSESADAESIEVIKGFWDDADPRIRTMSGQYGKTLNGLLRYFTSAWDGLNSAWIGRYGESIVDTPTPEQLEYLLEKDGGLYQGMIERYKRGGSYQYLLDEYEIVRKKGQSALINYKRKFPFTPNDSFRPKADTSYLNQEHVNRVLDQLTDESIGHIPLHQHLTVRGDLVWDEDKVKGDVVFVPNDQNGRFLFNRKYVLRKEANKYGHKANDVTRMPPRDGVEEEWGAVRTKPNYAHVIGQDPFAIDKEMARSKGLSLMGMCGFLKFDPSIDGGWKMEEGKVIGAENFYTHSFVFVYLARPSIDEQNMDTLKAAIYLGAKVNPETNRGDIVPFFVEMGCAGLLFTAMGDRIMGKRQAAHFGTHSNTVTQQAGLAKVRSYVQYFPFPEKNPFIKLWDQWRRMSPTTLGKFDLGVASMWTLTAALPKASFQSRKNDDIEGQKKVYYPTYGIKKNY